MSAKLLQLTNSGIGAVAADGFMPLGITTVSFPTSNITDCGPTFTVTSSLSDTVQINKAGTYSVVYSLTAVAEAAGLVTIALVVNGVTKYVVSTTATADGTVNLTLPWELYVPCNCCTNPLSVPAIVQLQNTGVALTSGASNLIIDKE
jgi:hypothetical protein